MTPEDLRYSKTHEWANLADGVVTVGITKFAVELLTDLTHVELPKAGRKLTGGAAMGEVESVKAVSDLYAPCDGEVVEVNAALKDNAALIGEDPYGAGWLVRIKPSAAEPLKGLMDLAAYEKQTAEGH